MKNLIIILGLLIGISAQAQTLKENTQWLEKQLNTLGSDEEQSFRFKNCQFQWTAKIGEGGFSMNMNTETALQDIEKVSYTPKKEKGKAVFEIIIKTKEKKSTKDELNVNFTNSVSTSDEKLAKEIVQRFEQAIKQCSK
jgi:hypothetical protein